MSATADTTTGRTRVVRPDVEFGSAVTLTLWDDGHGPSELVLDSDGPCPLGPADVDRLIAVLIDLRGHMTSLDSSPHPGPWGDMGGRR